MENDFRRAPFFWGLIALASVAVIVAGLRAGSSIVGPFLLTFVIGLFTVPLEFLLIRHRVPRGLAFILVFLLTLLLIVFVILAISVSAAQFQASQAMHAQQLAAAAQQLANSLERFGFTVTNVQALSSGVESVDIVAIVINEMLKFLSDAFLVIMLLFFLLMDAPGFFKRLERSAGYTNPVIQNFGSAVREVLGSLYIVTGMNVLQAVYIFIFLAVLNVQFALLWALLAFLFLYIPVVGLLIATIPAIYSTLLQYDLGMALVVAIGILVVPFFFQRFVQRRFVPRTTTVSLLVIFFAVIVSTWIFGFSGLLLAVPIVIALQIIFESFSETRWLAELMNAGNQAPAGKA